MTRTRILLILAAILIAVVAVGLRFWATPATILHSWQLGAGQPLESHTKINVLPGQEDAIATPLTQSNQPLASSSTITLAPPVPVVATPTAVAIPPAVFDATAAQLGTTLSLLVNAWPQGGPLPRQLASAAATLAEQTGQPQLAAAAAALRVSTPREGPLTLQALLLETTRVLTLTPPDDLPQTDADAEAQKSWFRKQLEQLVTISSTPATQNRWSAALLTVQQQLVRGAVADAENTLADKPLKGDDRLEQLRGLIHEYLGQTGRLTNLVTAYTNVYLLKSGE